MEKRRLSAVHGVKQRGFACPYFKKGEVGSIGGGACSYKGSGFNDMSKLTYFLHLP